MNGTVYTTNTSVQFNQDDFIGTKEAPLKATVNRKWQCEDGNSVVEDEDVFSIEPNPFTDDFTISLQNIRSGKVEVLDAQGKIIIVKEMNETNVLNIQTQTKLHQLSDGLYLVRITMNDGTIEQKRVLKISK